jgi:hypothetical protein
VLQATAAAIVLFAAGCGPELEPNSDDTARSPAPTVAESASPTISADAADEAGRSTDEEAEAGDRPAAAGECAAYVDSDDWCTDGIGDYDCEDGSGDGPNYAPSDVEVVNPGTDPFGLDDDDDGDGCEGPAPAPPAPPPNPGTDPRFDTCAEAIDNGYGPYYRGQDPEYDWYRDADGDGVVCE